MIRTFLAALTALQIVTASQPVVDTQTARERIELASALKTLPTPEVRTVESTLKDFKIDLDKVIASQQVLSPGQDFRIQREVEDRLKPVPFTKTGLTPVLTQAPFEYYESLTPAEEALLTKRRESVGRLESTDGSKRTLEGTAFVLTSGTIATNCHVLNEIATNAGGNWTLDADTWLDVGLDGGHSDSDEFKVTGVAAISAVRGLDVAVLTVASMSIDKSRRLPDPLPISRTNFVKTPIRDAVKMGIVGYPDLAAAVDPIFRDLKSKTTSAKIYSPGVVMSTETVSNVDLLFHLANTMKGFSGSPIMERQTFEVIGIHNCCTAGAVSGPVSTLACADVLKKRPWRNGAIAGWTAGADSTLKSFFVIPAP